MRSIKNIPLAVIIAFALLTAAYNSSENQEKTTTENGTVLFPEG